MADPAEIVDRVVALVHTCVPPEELGEVSLPAIACLVGGAVMIFWGSKLVRALIVIAGATAGGYGGWLIAQHLAKPPAIGLVVGAVMVGVLGLVLTRLWIAALSGALAGLVALSVCGYRQDLPGRFDQFIREYRQPAPSANNEFPLADPGTTEALESLRTYEILMRFAEYLERADDPLLRRVLLWVGGAGLFGIVIGLVAYRGAMIFWTSLAGLALVVGSGVVLLTNYWPEWHGFVVKNASNVGLVMLGVWLVGMLVQWRGTRRRVGPVGRPVAAAATLPNAT